MPTQSPLSSELKELYDAESSRLQQDFSATKDGLSYSAPAIGAGGIDRASPLRSNSFLPRKSDLRALCWSPSEISAGERFSLIRISIFSFSLRDAGRGGKVQGRRSSSFTERNAAMWD